MSYYETIDPIGEEKKQCLYCGRPTNETYCSTECKYNDNFDY
jgi:hypothetical protein